ncbi:DAK2 domain-containing protein [Clostridium kluyveri]|uniref:Dihydroxyacetone kinase n=1 Tax=Clostridium kluyveri TaxID=1534 RepID=A0A1L5F7E6_CLOKL|nr:DAK2 domain-containing protein [Clostridium kluyveri]APM38750.1 dihydroxyacetone kinase [Clostridium kluyveri]UZQ51069.1 DAK2 domain-containing protein [Clostridium kluyveri]
MEYLSIDGQCFYNMIVNASNKLEEQKDFVNSLNVFPVPDGDTGTNMSLTLKSAVVEISNVKGKSIDNVSKDLAKGALMGARGNSGVILSQIFRGISKGLQGKNKVNSSEFTLALEEGAKAAYKAVMRPTEGTILTIIKAAGEGAAKSKRENVTELLQEVCDYSKRMLDKTPDMLPVLKKAGVVDAGGMGLLIIFQGMYEALKEGIEEVYLKKAEDIVTKSSAKSVELEEIKYGYCTEFFIHLKNSDISSFKDKLQTLGDSIVVVKDEDVLKVHIHSNDPGEILSQAIKLGELSKIKIDNMRQQHRNILNADGGKTLLEDTNKDSEGEGYISQEGIQDKEYAFITVAAGEGIKRIFQDLGVDYVIEGGQTMNPSTEDILNCINKLNAENIFVLPNNKNIIMAANQAAELSDKVVRVIPTKTIPQGITAITVFNPGEGLEENISTMEKAISTVITGSVTYAVRDTEIDGKDVKTGDILGIIESKIEKVGKDIFEICDKIISYMVKEHSELISIYYGKDCNEDEVNSFLEKLEDKYDDIDIQCYSGEQPLYYFIVSVE